ncbi:pyridoxamine 5'-phosphate oxidase [Ancylomarina longa]|uniref:Pyridoxine/pyridoxamine 5'-phosphate oxidase n=1 Tax=Ancylomarina longa TaxID=2487017 RepID=A0A434AY88_9BACT|nr:pyridoxamine 5'-phosphate oxidase [Ancylomarina longa]RUT79531.1 pyridoxamine 5'-phosphate oxidase [Ancylomarina longa]
MKDDLNRIRHEYGNKELSKSNVSPDPFIQFQIWFKAALNENIPDVNAMTLATANSNGRPSARILLLKDFNEDGFCFFTNYESKKGNELLINPYGALVFFWPEMERQIRIEGKIAKLESDLSDAYFYQRPIGSRIAAAVSPQSQEITDRKSIIKKIDQFKVKNGDEFKRPDFWGGYRLIPDLFEFWQGRENRLNDRIEYTIGQNQWKLRCLAP